MGRGLRTHTRKKTLNLHKRGGVRCGCAAKSDKSRGRRHYIIADLRTTLGAEHITAPQHRSACRSHLRGKKNKDNMKRIVEPRSDQALALLWLSTPYRRRCTGAPRRWFRWRLRRRRRQLLLLQRRTEGQANHAVARVFATTCRGLVLAAGKSSDSRRQYNLTQEREQWFCFLVFGHESAASSTALFPAGASSNVPWSKFYSS